MLSFIASLLMLIPVAAFFFLIRYLGSDPAYGAYRSLVEPVFWLTTLWWAFTVIRGGGK